MILRVALVAGFAATAVATAAQQPTLDQVLSRLDAYLEGYEATLATIIAEELYSQVVTRERRSAAQPHSARLLRSDYALARSPGGHAWTGFRDTYEVDGQPVRDREGRLMALLAEGSATSAQQALRITRENARYNIGEDVVTRTINVPTVALDVIHRRNRSRFSLDKRSEDDVAGRPVWVIAFRERGGPTMLRTPQGKDRRANGTVWIDPVTGAVLRTVLSWEDAPSGRITVQYRPDANIDALVPDWMTEEYQGRDGVVTGEATYTNYRQFRTAVRIVTH